MPGNIADALSGEREGTPKCLVCASRLPFHRGPYTPPNQGYPWSSQYPPGRSRVKVMAVTYFVILYPSLTGEYSRSGAPRSDVSGRSFHAYAKIVCGCNALARSHPLKYRLSNESNRRYRAAGVGSTIWVIVETGTPVHVAIAVHPSTQWCLTVYVTRGKDSSMGRVSRTGLRTSPPTSSAQPS